MKNTIITFATVALLHFATAAVTTSDELAAAARDGAEQAAIDLGPGTFRLTAPLPQRWSRSGAAPVPCGDLSIVSLCYTFRMPLPRVDCLVGQLLFQICSATGPEVHERLRPWLDPCELQFADQLSSQVGFSCYGIQDESHP